MVWLPWHFKAYEKTYPFTVVPFKVIELVPAAKLTRWGTLAVRVYFSAVAPPTTRIL